MYARKTWRKQGAYRIDIHVRRPHRTSGVPRIHLIAVHTLRGSSPPRNVDGLSSRGKAKHRTIAELIIIITLHGNFLIVPCFLRVLAAIRRCTWGLGRKGVAGVRSEKSLELCLGLQFVFFRP